MTRKQQNKHLSVRIPESFHSRLEAVSGEFGIGFFVRAALMAAVEEAEAKAGKTRKSAPAKDAPTPPEETQKTPAKRTWQDVRDIVEAQLVTDGEDPAETMAGYIENYGEEGWWRLYMTLPACAEKLAIHDAAIR